MTERNMLTAKGDPAQPGLAGLIENLDPDDPDYGTKLKTVLDHIAAPSGVAAKLVDELLSGSFETMEQVDEARAALLDYIVEKDAEIERYRAAYEVEKNYSALRCDEVARLTQALAACLKAAQVPEELRKLSEAATSGECTSSIPNSATELKMKSSFDAAVAERDLWKEACRRAGVCMSCAIRTPEPFGCTDCLNTGWNCGEPVECQKARDEAFELAASDVEGCARNGRSLPSEMAACIRARKGSPTPARQDSDMLREALIDARKTVRNAWGAISSGQTHDKQVERLLRNLQDHIDAALNPTGDA